MKTIGKLIALAVTISALSLSASAADLGWLAGGIESGKTAPFSFAIDGAPAEITFDSAKKESLKNGGLRLDADYRIKGQSVAVALQAEFSAARDFVRLTLTLKGGDKCSAELYQIRPLDLALPRDEAGGERSLCAIHGGEGTMATPFPPRSFAPHEIRMTPGRYGRQTTGMTGRSSDEYIPVWLLAGEKGGIWAGAEWTGASEGFAHNASPVRFQALLPTFAFYVEPGETLVLPTVGLGSYTGGKPEGYNAIRGAIREHYLPPINGTKPSPQVIFQGLGGFPTYQDEAGLYKEADAAARVGAEQFVLDAGWNFPPTTQNWGPYVGIYTPDKERFPRGLDTFFAHVKSKGMRPGIWIEPRFRDHVPVVKERPEFFYPPARSMTLPALERREVRDWYFDMVCGLIETSGAQGLWLDFNCQPRKEFWDILEKPGRRGLMELRWYQGYYEVMDRLRAKYPDLWIENCASGGNVIDLGMLRRSHSFWINDHSYDDEICRSMRSGANLILPSVSIQSGIFLWWELKGKIPAADKLVLSSPERFLNYFGSNFQFCQGLLAWRDRDLDAAAGMVAVFKKYRHYFDGAYDRPLPMPRDLRDWDAWQFHDPKTGSGLLFAFRLSESDAAQRVLALAGVGPTDDLHFETVAGSGTASAHKTGASVQIPNKGGACLIHYRKK
jgi:alpha-galactosidase